MDLALNNLQWLICHETKPNNHQYEKSLWHSSESRLQLQDHLHIQTNTLGRGINPLITPQLWVKYHHYCTLDSAEVILFFTVPACSNPSWSSCVYRLTPEAPHFRRMPMGLETFLELLGASLKKALCHTRPVGETVNKYRAISAICKTAMCKSTTTTTTETEEKKKKTKMK